MNSKKTLMRRIILILCIVLAVVMTALAVGHKLLFVQPTVTQTPAPDPDQSTDQPDTNLSGRKDDFYTFLVLGRDTAGGGNTDTMILVSYDVAGQTLDMVNLPRDTMVEYNDWYRKVNGVYNLAGGGEDGLDALDAAVAALIGFTPDFRIVVEWDAVGDLVDALGGVWFDVPWQMDYDDPTQDLYIHIDKGYQLLDGEDAMKVIRYRDGNNGTGYPNGDLGRIATQQAFLAAVVTQCLQLENITRINQLAQVFTNNVTTELTVNNLAWFAQQAIFGGLTSENTSFYTLPTENAPVWSNTYQNYQSYLTILPDEVIALLNDTINPFVEPLTLDDLCYLYIDQNNTVRSSDGGTFGSASRPVIQEEPEETPEEEPEAYVPTTPATTPTPDTGADPDIYTNLDDGSDPETEEEPEPEPEPEPESDTTDLEDTTDTLLPPVPQPVA